MNCLNSRTKILFFQFEYFKFECFALEYLRRIYRWNFLYDFLMKSKIYLFIDSKFLKYTYIVIYAFCRYISSINYIIVISVINQQQATGFHAVFKIQ